MHAARILKRTASFVLIAILASLNAAVADTPASTSEPDPHPALWKVEDNNSTFYIFGSIHLLPDYVAWKSPTVTGAMAKSKTFVFETSDDQSAAVQTQDFITERGLQRNGQRLRAMLSSDAQTQFDKRLTEFGYAPNKFDTLNPWLASVILKVTFLESIGYSSDAGADTTIESYARHSGRDFRYLEGPQVGLNALAKLGEKTGVESVEATLADMDEMPAILQNLIERWQNGDVPAMSAMLDRSLSDNPEIGKDLLLDRNHAWSEEIDRLSSQHTTFFITVGIAHLAGHGSLIEDLCTKGLRVSRVDTSTPTNACASA